MRTKYGRDYFAKIRKKGGATVCKGRGASFYAEIGTKGATRPRPAWVLHSIAVLASKVAV